MAYRAIVIMAGLVIAFHQARSSVLPKADQSNAPKVQTANQRHKIQLAPAPVHVQLLHTKEGEVVVAKEDVPKMEHTHAHRHQPHTKRQDQSGHMSVNNNKLKADNVHHLKKHGPHHSAHASARPRHHHNRNLHQQPQMKVHVQRKRPNKHGSHPSVGRHHVNSTVHGDSPTIRHHLKHVNHHSKTKHHRKSAGHALAGKRFQRQHKKTGYRTQSHQEAVGIESGRAEEHLGRNNGVLINQKDKGQRAKSDSRKERADKYDELWSLLEGHSKRGDPSALPASDDEEHRSPLKVKKRKKAAHKHDKKVIFASRALRHGKHRLWQRLFKE
ncbi:uncharacterized protein LOC144885151 isoform X2 [Branchiostoma floridae x Branchiostoma japonicum]